VKIKLKLKIVRSLLLLTAVTVIFFASKYAIANISYLRVDSYLVRWQEKKVAEQPELEDALISVESMLALHGHFPHYLNVAAKVYEWQAFMDLKTKDNSLLQALDYYQQSAELRSHWPLTWVFMANIKAKLNQFDDDFYFYLDNAIKYGPYTHEVNLQVAKLQLQYWGELERLPIKVGLEHIKRALLNYKSSYTLLNFSRDINRQGVVCTVAKLNEIKAMTRNEICKTL